MASTKKYGKKSSALLPNASDDVHDHLAHYVQETNRLEAAYASLHKQFYHLKEKWEASHLTLEILLSHMSEGMMFVTQAGLITLLNPAAADLLSCSVESIVQRPYAACFADYLFGFSMRQEINELEKHRRVFLTLCQAKEIEVSTSPIPGKGLLLLLSNEPSNNNCKKAYPKAKGCRNWVKWLPRSLMKFATLWEESRVLHIYSKEI